VIGFTRQDERINNASLGKKENEAKLEEKDWFGCRNGRRVGDRRQ
jgi:hypothetical protein